MMVYILIYLGFTVRNILILSGIHCKKADLCWKILFRNGLYWFFISKLDLILKPFNPKKYCNKKFKLSIQLWYDDLISDNLLFVQKNLIWVCGKDFL